MSSDTIRISPGDVIDDFEIAEVIATGGSSTTFRATSKALARDVSLKYVHPAVFGEDGAAIDAARADATRVARLEHPGVAPVFAAGLYEGGLYIASAMAKGRTLAELGAEGSITPVDAARVLSDVAAALEAAHEQGVVHRDLRPECVTVDRWGHGVVRDFGVTRVSGRTGLLTRAEVLESLRYTAPELVLGRPATPAADVYELGALAVWCLTGATPYRDRPAAEYVVFRAEAPPPVLAQPDGAPATTLNTVLKAAMAVDPGERPSPTEFAGALSYAVSRLPAAIAEAGCPFSSSEESAPVVAPTFEPAPAPALALGAGAGAELPGVRDVTRAEHRRPLPAPPSAAAAPTPWGTYAACAAVAVALGLAGALAGRAGAPAPPPPIKIGAFSLDAGDTWTRVAATGDSKLVGASLAGPTGEPATVGIVAEPRLPGDPLPAALLPDADSRPRALSAGGAALVGYEGSGDRVVARPTSRGTIAARCARPIALARCAALVVHTDGPGRGLAVLPSAPVSAALREQMTAIEQATGIASAELKGDTSEQAGAVGRLATALGEAATALEVDGVDRGTGAQLAALRAALTGEAAALEDLGGAIDRRSDVAFDAATDQIRANRRKLTAALAGLRRAGYPVGR